MIKRKSLVAWLALSAGGVGPLRGENRLDQTMVPTTSPGSSLLQRDIQPSP